MNDVILDAKSTFDPSYKEFVRIEMSEGFHIDNSPLPTPKLSQVPEEGDGVEASSNPTLIDKNSLRSYTYDP